MPEPLVSILIPAFNSQQWIAETLSSAVMQTWPRKEIIVVDDGSTDNTFQIARSFEPHGVRIITQQNQGAAAARNKALSLSRGDYIQWLDADDLMSPDKIARQMEAMEQYQSKRILFSCGWGRFICRHARAKFVPTALWCDLSPREWLLRRMEQNLYMQTATWLVSRELTEAAGPWDTRLLGDDDKEYFCRVLLLCDEVRFVPRAKVYYRAAGEGSLSYIGRSDRKLDALWHSVRLHMDYLLLLEDSERTRAACLEYLQTSLVDFYPERLDIMREAEKICRNLGGRLHTPRLSWKYAWIKALFGWRLAKRAQLSLRIMKWRFLCFWDRALNEIERRAGYRRLGSLRA